MKAEALNKLVDEQELVERDTVNQLVKVYEKTKQKLPFSVTSLTPLKKLKIKAVLRSLEASIANVDTGEVDIADINLNEVRTNLSRIRTR